ncbi:MAG: hypothetical protein JWQ23_2339 [Herminiimonas sp.]|nr:hypothetical protein [Herminiimonas sp.]
MRVPGCLNGNPENAVTYAWKSIGNAIYRRYLQSMLKGYEQDLAPAAKHRVNGCKAEATIREEMKQIRKQLETLDGIKA